MSIKTTIEGTDYTVEEVDVRKLDYERKISIIKEMIENDSSEDETLKKSLEEYLAKVTEEYEEYIKNNEINLLNKRISELETQVAILRLKLAAAEKLNERKNIYPDREPVSPWHPVYPTYPSPWSPHCDPYYRKEYWLGTSKEYDTKTVSLNGSCMCVLIDDSIK